jgi:hypothetical protein
MKDYYSKIPRREEEVSDLSTLERSRDEKTETSILMKWKLQHNQEL